MTLGTHIARAPYLSDRGQVLWHTRGEKLLVLGGAYRAVRRCRLILVVGGAYRAEEVPHPV